MRVKNFLKSALFQEFSLHQNGYFITPGDGVRLPNGKVVGKDIVLDKKADIAAMARDEQALMFQGKPLAHKLDIKASFLDQVLQENVMRPEDGMIWFEYWLIDR